MTNIEYAHFVEATGHSIPEYWIEGTFPTEKATHPVTGITPKDAKVYCKWLSQETGKSYRLPTEWEWEWAATGSQGWRYPWGDQFDKDNCNTEEAAIGETTPVGSYLAGINQYGMADMSGNVWEITQGYISPLLSLNTVLLAIVVVLLIVYALNYIVIIKDSLGELVLLVLLGIAAISLAFIMKILPFPIIKEDIKSLVTTVTTQVPKRPVKVDHERQRQEQRAWSDPACAW